MFEGSCQRVEHNLHSMLRGEGSRFSNMFYSTPVQSRSNGALHSDILGTLGFTGERLVQGFRIQCLRGSSEACGRADPPRDCASGVELRVSGSGFLVLGFGFWFRASGSGFRVKGLGFRVSSSGSRGFGFGLTWGMPTMVPKLEGLTVSVMYALQEYLADENPPPPP